MKKFTLRLISLSYLLSATLAATPPPKFSSGQRFFSIDSSPSAKSLETQPTQIDLSAFPPQNSIAQAPETELQQFEEEEIFSEQEQKTVLINFNNISIIEYLRFISRTTNKNFIFDENDLQFNVTIISEEPATIENIMTALLQELRIHDLALIEQGNNFIIHRNPKVNAISQVVNDDFGRITSSNEIITQVFRLNTANPTQVAAVIKPLTSDYALVDVLEGTNHLIITDLSANIAQIAKLIKSVDSPISGLVVGQYVVRTTSPEVLIEMARQLISPIAQDQPLTFVPWDASNSIFVVSTPFLVERSLSMLQHIDQNEKSTRIFDLKDLRYQEEPGGALPETGLFLNNSPYAPTPEEIEQARQEAEELRKDRAIQEEAGPGRWAQDAAGNWVFLPEGGPVPEISPAAFPLNLDTQRKIYEDLHNPERPPAGSWHHDGKGNWYFLPTPGAEDIPGPAPHGHWYFNPILGWRFKLDETQVINIRRVMRDPQPTADIPLGAKQKSYFSIYRLQFRKGNTIQFALRSIAEALRMSEPGNEDLIATLLSVQWLESSNSLIFTGYKENLLKMRNLMREVDTPLRQVFIEVLVLETDITDSLEYGVTWGSRFAGEHWAGAESFSTNLSPIDTALDLADTTAGLGPTVVNSLINREGLNMGVIGQKIFNRAFGLEFSSIGALLHALRTKINTDVILSPKIITEDGVPAEIFVGENVSFKTQSIANDNSNTITNNFEYRDVGTRLRVTPFIGNNDIISLEISQEISSIILDTLPTDQNSPGPSTRKSTTTTRVHMPDGYFLIISGMVRDQKDHFSTQIPCLGAIPVLGGAFKDKGFATSKRNQMIFLRPKIVDTEEEIQNLTKHEQDIWAFQRRRKQDWVYETEGALEFLNLKRDIVEADPEFADKDS